MPMTSRERFVKTLTGEKVDRVPFMKVFGGSNWIRPEWEREHPGIKTTIDSLLGFEGANRGWTRTPVNMDPSNLGKPVIIEQTESKTVRDRGDGTIEEVGKGGDYHRHTIKWPVKDRATWEAYREKHMNADDPARFPANWSELVKQYKNREYPLQLTHRGVYGFIRERVGDENLAYMFYDDPALVHDIMNYYTDFAIRLWEKQTAEVEFDLIECWEDMASKNGSLISPQMFREFMTPCFRKIAAFAKSHGIKTILVDSDGYIDDLAVLMREGGVLAMYPFEVQAGCDVPAVRKVLPDLGIVGGLNKEVMAYGRDAIDKEIEKARALIKVGRLIPGPDHKVLGNVTFANYRYFMERLRDAVMTTTPGN
jgi:uroporphyrinogen decarboxylase